MSEYTQDNIDLTVTTPLGDNKLLLQSLNGEDRISGLFHYQLEMISEESDLAADDIIGQSVTVKMAYAEGDFFFNGHVARFVQAGTNQRFTTYYAELKPWLWFLTMHTDSRIFQEMDVTEIIQQVFDDAGFSDYKVDTKGSYQPREYTVQFQESSFNFVSRMMEDEGLFYFFEHEDGKHTLVISDDTSAHVPREGATPARVKPQDSSSWGENIITHVAMEQQVTVGAYAMTDYNFEQPSNELKVNVSGKDKKKLEVFEYPGGYGVKGDGEGRVKLRIEAHELPSKLLRGQGHCRAFMSGYKMSVEEHVREDLNADYVLSWTSHSVNHQGYSNSFEGFPADVPFRPKTLTRKPRMVGTQTGVVTGPDGEEIFTDKYGRIKVHFHWDRAGTKDDKASVFIRVAQAWAGKGWGQWWLPRIGQEVVISFIDGDVDRPLITGSVYNGEQTVPYALPDHATKSTMKSDSSKGHEGFNELRFEDKKDEEEIFMHAQKDWNSVIEHDFTRETLNDEFITITKNREVKILEENELLVVEKGDRTIEVNTGLEQHSVEGTRTVNIVGDELHTNDGNFDHKVKGDYTLKVDGNISIEAGGKIDMKAGSSFSMKAGTSMKSEAGTSMDSKAGTSLKCKAGTTLDAEAGVSFTVKGSASGTVDGGGMLTLKGGLVKIN